MQNNSFVHLSLHTEFSLNDSLVRVKPLMSAVKDRGMCAVGISDASNMFAAIRFYSSAMGKGIKPIISSELTVVNQAMSGKLTLICQNDKGYKNLIELVSRGYDESQIRPAIFREEWLESQTEGLIALSGGREGMLGKLLLSDRKVDAVRLAQKYMGMYPDRFYIELQRVGHPDDDKYVDQACRLAVHLGLPVVATNGVRFIDKEDFKAHEIRAAIAEKMSVSEFRRVHQFKYTQEQYLKSPAEMATLFRDIPSAIENTVAISHRCSIDITLGKNYLPSFPVPDGMTEATFLSTAAKKGLEERLVYLYGKNNPDIAEIRKKYDERIDFELNVINQMGFPGYFLIVSDFIQWSKDNNIPVGPGRGSGAGSLVAYALKITDLDPLKYDLLFERFLNPERVSMPDFDVDFCMDRREEVIKYVADKYGHKAVSQIITFGTMAAKMVVRDVARALGYPYQVGNRISQMIPGRPGVKLSEAMDESADFQAVYQNDPEVREVYDLSLKLEGITRQTGKHAGGVIISPTKLTDFTPTYSEPDGSSFVSQFDKNDVEYAGLVKFDFLGLRTLTIVQGAVDAINAKKRKKGEPDVDILAIPMDDHAVFKSLQNGDTTAVFQVESKGMKDLLKRLKPDCFEDLIALVALYRPGPLESGMVDNFINRKHGREELAFPDPNYQHESLRTILEPTYGIILYQEQVMQIAQVLAGYTLGGADMLRRAMGKKKPEEMEKQRSVFKEGAIKNGVDGDLAMKIFDLVEKFAGYGFNKSHSAAYALISYQTAWLKEHYPSEFMAAVLSSGMGDTEKVVTYINECRKMNLDIVPPKINISERKFFASSEKEIVYGLEAIKGMGATALEAILEERKLNGEFKSLTDLCMRCNPNKRTFEAAIQAGVLDGLGPNRAALMMKFQDAQLIGKQAKKTFEIPQDDMFGSIIDNNDLIDFNGIPDWTDKVRLAGERKTLGLFLTGHPMDEYENEVASFTDGKLAEITEITVESGADGEAAEVKQFKPKPVKVAGLIMDVNIKEGKQGHSAYLVLDDKSRQIEVAVYTKTYDECANMLRQDAIVVIDGSLRYDRVSGRHKIVAYNVKSIDMIREEKVSHIMLNISLSDLTPEKIAKLKEITTNQPEGGCQIMASHMVGGQQKVVSLGNKKLKMNDALIASLSDLFGKDSVSVEYKSEGKQQINKAEIAKAQAESIIRIGNETRKERHGRISTLLYEAERAMG